MSKILSIDYGSKNIGLALADQDLKIPYPLGSVPNNDQAIEQIKKVINQEEVDTVVVGLPIQSFGGEGQAVATVRDFSQKLEAVSGQKIVFEDERYSSAMVKKMMIEQKDYDKDAVEAMVILESYLVKIKNQNEKL